MTLLPLNLASGRPSDHQRVVVVGYDGIVAYRSLCVRTGACALIAEMILYLIFVDFPFQRGGESQMTRGTQLPFNEYM